MRMVTHYQTFHCQRQVSNKHNNSGEITIWLCALHCDVRVKHSITRGCGMAGCYSPSCAEKFVMETLPITMHWKTQHMKRVRTCWHGYNHFVTCCVHRVNTMTGSRSYHTMISYNNSLATAFRMPIGGRLTTLIVYVVHQTRTLLQCANYFQQSKCSFSTNKSFKPVQPTLQSGFLLWRPELKVKYPRHETHRVETMKPCKLTVVPPTIASNDEVIPRGVACTFSNQEDFHFQ